MHGSMSSVAIYNSLTIAPDSAGLVHCLDAETGKKHWTHDTDAGIWASPLIVDGKVYVAYEDGTLFVFELAKQKKLLAQREFDNAIESSPVYANGVLYVMTHRVLYAIKHQR
jgi:outer membrane protein assembly factor BamB